MRLRVIAATLLITTVSSASYANSVATPKAITLQDQAAAKATPATDGTVGATLPATPQDVIIAQQTAQHTEDNKSTEASPAQVCDTLHAAAEAHDLPTPFFIRLIWQESRFDRNAVSPVGAQGVAQFMPRVAAAMGLENPFDPIAALPVSAQLLRTLHDQFGNLGLAAAAYNAGPKRVIDWLTKRGQLPKETRDYVLNITGRPAEEWRGGNSVVQIHATVPNRSPCHPTGAQTVALASVPATLNPSIADDIPPDPPKTTRVAAKGKGKDEKIADKKIAGKADRKVALTKVAGRKGKAVIAEMSAAKPARKTKADAKGETKAAAAKSAKGAKAAKAGNPGPMRLASVAKAR